MVTPVHYFDVTCEVAYICASIQSAVFVGNGLGRGAIVSVFQRWINSKRTISVDAGYSNYLILIGFSKGRREGELVADFPAAQGANVEKSGSTYCGLREMSDEGIRFDAVK